MDEKRSPLAGLTLTDKAKTWSEKDLTASPAKQRKAKARALRRSPVKTERISCDFTQGVPAELRRIASEHATTVTAVVEWLVWMGFQCTTPDDLIDALTPGRSPRYDYKLDRHTPDEWQARVTKWTLQQRSEDKTSQ